MFKLFKSNEAKSMVHEGMTLEQVREAMLKLMAEESVNHHRMGQLYNYVVKKKLAEKAGTTSREWFSKHLVELSQSTLSQYGAVAAAFSEQATQRYGVSRLSLLLAYMAAKELEVNNADPGGTLIEVPDSNGQVTEKAFSACTAEDLRKAIQRKRKPVASKPVPPEAVALADQYQEAVESRFPVGSLITVEVRNQKGKAVLDFKGIPVEQVSTLIAALSELLPLMPQVRQVEKVEKVAPSA